MPIDLYLPKRKRFENQKKMFQLTKKTLKKDSKKFWQQRYSLFSRFDQGVFMNQELWYSVTPESVAIFLAKFIQACDSDIKCVLDVFCGGGGNTIQFARKFDKCIGIDFNQENLYCAEKNCYIYGVEDKTELIYEDWTNMEDDTMTYLEKEVDFVFASPPWGGTGYKNKNIFDLDYLLPLSIKDLLITFFKISQNVCLFLPRNSNLIQLSQVTKELLGPEAICRVIYAYNDGFIKGLLVFFGNKFLPDNIDRETLSAQNKLIIEQFQEEQKNIKKGTSYEVEQSVETSAENSFENISTKQSKIEEEEEQIANLIKETETKKEQAAQDSTQDKKNRKRKRKQDYNLQQMSNQTAKKVKKGKKRQKIHKFFDDNGDEQDKVQEAEAFMEETKEDTKSKTYKGLDY